MQGIERDVFIEIIGQAAEVGHNPGRLFLLCKHMRRQESPQTERIAFLLGKSGALVQQRIAQQSQTARKIDCIELESTLSDVSMLFLVSQGLLRVTTGPTVLCPQRNPGYADRGFSAWAAETLTPFT